MRRFVTIFRWAVLISILLDEGAATAGTTVAAQRVQRRRDAARGIRCRRHYNRGYYGQNRCTNYCNCPQYYGRYNCPPCVYGTYPTYVQPVVITCNCDPDGSLFDTCNSSGQCMCNPNYVGAKCKRCKNGFWKHPRSGCINCSCHPDGSHSLHCHAETGRCSCKDGVGGDSCDSCLPHHYGNISEGCKKCDTCDKKGHICHPQNGRCVCPPLTVGYTCERCAINAWGYEGNVGCKNCSCSSAGSVRSQCDINSGKCECKKGYDGEKCDSCTFGHYGYPDCKRCTCNPAGTLESEFVNGIARCDPDGNCKCKENVEGGKCDRCKYGTFGLDKNNANGCLKCFCFERSDTCVAVDYTWDQIHTENLTYTKENCLFSSPCINLPEKFTGDLTLSYGGFLRIISPSTSAEFFVRLTGNNVTIESGFGDDIKLDEYNWRMFRTSDKLMADCNRELNRKCFMVILQNVSNIAIKTATVDDVTEVLLDKAVLISSAQRTRTIERCDCPPEYGSLSCQDPNVGYYRKRLQQEDSSHTWVDRIVGLAEKCHCNGLSENCDRSTGHCLNCRNHTTGTHCEYCSEGFYRTSDNNCAPCLCPSEKQNFAKNCTPNHKLNHFVCHCKEGYTGKKCTKCDEGFFGRPHEPEGSCQKCNCNRYGSMTGNCDKETGRCECYPGFTGKQCDRCESPRKFIQNGLCTPCDECTQLLFNKMDELTSQLNDTIVSFEDGVQGPWRYLDAVDDRYNKLKERYAKTDESRKIFSKNWEDMRKYEDKSNNLYSTLKKKSKQLSTQLETIRHNRDLTDNIATNITQLQNRLNKFVEDMNQFGTSHLDVQNSLDKVKKLLKEIDNKAKEIKTIKDFETTFNECDNTFEKIQNTFKPVDANLENITKSVDEIKMRYEDINNLSNFVKKEIKDVKLKNKNNFIKYQELSRTASILNNRHKMMLEDINVSQSKLVATSKIIEEIDKLSDELSDSNLDKYFDQLEERSDDYQDGAIEVEKYIKTIKQHVGNMNATLENLKTLINFTKEEWQKINAGESYENILKGISEAEAKAKEAQTILKVVDELMNPSDNDAVLTQSSLSLGLSDRLKQRIINHMNQNELPKRVDDVKYELDNLERDIYKNGKSNNHFNSLLHDLKDRMSACRPNGIEIKKIIETASDISRNMTKIISDVNTMRYVNEHDLTRPFNKYLAQVSKENVRKLNEQIYSKINEVERLNVNANLNSIVARKSDLLTKNYERFDALKNKILALKANITFTRQRVNNLYLPISLVNCSRWYQAKNVGVFNGLKMKFNCTTCDLLGLSSGGQTISMGVVDGLFTLKWNESPIEVQVERDSVTNVEINRVRNNLLFQINDRTYTIPDQKLLHIGEDDYISVGALRGAPRSQPQQGCLHELFLNGLNIGLWNFKKSLGDCSACEKDTTGLEQSKISTLYVENSYTIYNVSMLNPQKFSVSLNFRTFDENSLLFLAQETSNPCAFISLSLKNGYLEFYMRHNDNTTIVSIATSYKCNDGKQNNVNLALHYKDMHQSYELTLNGLSFSRSRNIFRMHVFRIRQSKYYVGGVSPDFDKTCINVNTTSFVGFLKAGSDKDLDAVVSYNTFPQNTAVLNFPRAWFRGDGFVNLNTTTRFEKKRFTIYFEIFPYQNASSYVMNVEKVGKVIIENGMISFVPISGDRIQSETALNQILNTINITISETETILSVNGDANIANTMQLPEGDLVLLSIGEDPTKRLPGFLGGLSNIYIDNKNVNFNESTIIALERLEVGRWRNVKLPSEESPTSLTNTENPDNMQNTQGCFAAAAIQVDPSAIKFGDNMPSYVHRRSSFWKKNFTMEMQFRTLYPNGVLLFSFGPQSKPQYNLLEIRKGQLRYLIKGKRKPSTIIFESKVDDGNWHTVSIEQAGTKKNRKLGLALDGTWQKPSKVPKANVRNEFYIGGVPLNVTIEDLNTQQFIGCIRDLKINNIHQLNTKDLTEYKNLGSCFPKVEHGAYFGGDAYAIYKRDFKVSKQLDLSFEFKTSEQNGIMLTISNSGNSPALSIELQNGGMTMSVDLGNSPMFSVTNDLNSDYALCNNKWHNVSASYSIYELSVNIDGITRSWARYDTNTMLDEIEAPLYVGGLPDSAPTGTLKVRENFKGCLRKLKVNDFIMDWTDMEELNGVSLDSCPLID